tara:strand:+ start:331 stop:579 length:249 start_codon:yes stop_codon:yes gene_type:complete
MDGIQITSRIDQCIYFEFNDLLNQFDAIIDSIMETDLYRHTVREALIEWCDLVDDHVRLTVEKAQEVTELHLLGEELFGTEV